MPHLRTYFNLDNASGHKLLPLELLIRKFEFGHISWYRALKSRCLISQSINQRAIFIFKSYIPVDTLGTEAYRCLYSSLYKGSVNYGKVPVYVNTVYWNTAMLVHFHTDYMGCKAENIYYLSLYRKKFAELWSIWVV